MLFDVCVYYVYKHNRMRVCVGGGHRIIHFLNEQTPHFRNTSQINDSLTLCCTHFSSILWTTGILSQFVYFGPFIFPGAKSFQD